MPPKEKAAKCPVDGCKQRMTAATSSNCKQCKNLFCKEHSFPGGCRTLAPAQAAVK
jgi:predicted nucleic acid binding AN1-type Zn finger protein